MTSETGTPNTQIPSSSMAQPILTAIPSVPVNHGEKPEKFDGANFKRWQQKMLFYLTILSLAGYLREDAHVIAEGEQDRQRPSCHWLGSWEPALRTLFENGFQKWYICGSLPTSPGYSLRTFTGHSACVFSLDFHPNNDDLICSSDGGGEIRYWSINNGSCQRIFKGHTKPIYSICWDPSGGLLASVSADSVRVWTFGSGSEGDCIHELSCNDGNKFRSCVFHPSYASLLVIGCYQSLQLWNMNENKIMTLPAHDGLIAGLAVSPVTGLVASASHGKFVKLWK